MIVLPSNFINNLIEMIRDVFSDLMPLILLVMGILLGGYILSNLFWNWKEREYDDFLRNKK